MASSYHNPVMLTECIEALNINPEGIYVDVTFGGGGHSLKILERLKDGRLISFDQDEDAAANIIHNDRFFFIRHNFKYIRNFLKYYDVEQVDGILADLGVSSHDFDVAERGFSFRFDGDLDMRMNRDSSQTAAQNDIDSRIREVLNFKEIMIQSRVACCVRRNPAPVTQHATRSTFHRSSSRRGKFCRTNRNCRTPMSSANGWKPSSRWPPNPRHQTPDPLLSPASPPCSARARRSPRSSSMSPN